jgi:hypothetical protein
VACRLRRFVSSIQEFVVRDLVQEQSPSLDVTVDPAHARVPMSHDLVSSRFQCPRQHIDQQWNAGLRFCDISNRGDLLESEFDFLKYRVFSEDVTENSGVQNSGRPGKRISSGSAGVAAVPCPIVAR